MRLRWSFLTSSPCNLCSGTTNRLLVSQAFIYTQCGLCEHTPIAQTCSSKWKLEYFSVRTVHIALSVRDLPRYALLTAVRAILAALSEVHTMLVRNISDVVVSEWRQMENRAGYASAVRLTCRLNWKRPNQTVSNCRSRPPLRSGLRVTSKEITKLVDY